jgi:hypothetical protein
MSFQVLSLQTPLSVPQQMINACQTADNTTENFVMLNATKDGFRYRTVDIDRHAGQMYITGNSTAMTFSGANTYMPVALVGTTFDSGNSTSDFQMSADGILKFTGSDTGKLFHINCTITSYASAGTKNYRFRLTKNGVVIPFSYSTTTNRTDVQGTTNTNICIILILQTNDTLQLHVANETDSTTLIIRDYVLTAVSV